MRHAKPPPAWLLLPAILLGVAGGCLERRPDPELDVELTRCTTCHGDPAREGDALLRSAPPGDLWQLETVHSPGVGAHLIHLRPGKTHGAIACSECHVVPKHVDEPSHADDERPAELSFGDLAKHGDRDPSYDPVARTCADTWCHRDADAVWTEPKSSTDACGSCHQLPPPAPHPASDRCATCHGDVVDEGGTIIAPERHVNGIVDVGTPSCTICHGSGDDPAPPADTRGNLSSVSRGVGAHQSHLHAGLGRSLSCEECHQVPTSIARHPEAATAEVLLSGVATSADRHPTWSGESLSCSDTWCHSPSAPGDSPAWTSQAPLECSSCHGMPPALPHPQSTQCVACHADVINEDGELHALERHIDGIVDVQQTESCVLCHGTDADPAPPLDTRGESDPRQMGVGAHQLHLNAGGRARPVPCAECHRVPDALLAEAHLDSSLPAEVHFSGVAAGETGNARYSQGSCQNSYCHNARFASGDPSGALTPEPLWTDVTTEPTACESCHGMPPPRPHVALDNCSRCHHNVAADNRSFVAPELHVNGSVEFALP